MAFRSPFDSIMVQDTTLSVEVGGNWFELKSLQGIDAEKLVKIAGAMDENDDAMTMIETRLHEVMEALNAPLAEKVVAEVADEDGEVMTAELPCDPLMIENLEQKKADLTNALRGVIALAKATGASDKDVTTAYMLASGDNESAAMGGMDPMQAAMMGMMGGAGGPGGPGGPGGQQCQQQ